MTEREREDLLDLLSDLQHDLGKYVRLPLAMLPRDAGTAELRAALEEALLRTRRSPSGVRSAEALWESFCAEAGERLSAFAAMPALAAAVERALGWRAALADDGPLDRAALEADLEGVGRAIRALLVEVQR
jgi:hypothetical protein